MEIGGGRLGVQAEVMEKEKEVTYWHRESPGHGGMQEVEKPGGPRIQGVSNCCLKMMLVSRLEGGIGE